MSEAVHGGVKFYRGSASAARTYVEADRSRADDYYLTEGSGIAQHHVVTNHDGDIVVARQVDLNGDAYESWVAGFDTSGRAKGRLRTDEHGLRFVEVIVNGPKTWSLVAAVHPEIGCALDAAQDRAANEIINWLAEHATTRVGPRGRQVQVPVEQLEAAIVRHFTSRAGDPHRHLHLQINARVFAAGAWRGLHSKGVVDSIEALNGIGHAAVMCDEEFRTTLAAQGYTLNPTTGEVVQLAPYAPAFSARAAQITRNIDRYEAQWRTDHPHQEPGPGLRRSWDRRAWSDARPDKVVPTDGADLAARWREELHDLGHRPPIEARQLGSPMPSQINRDAVAELILSRLGANHSAWNGADIRGEAERIVASTGLVTSRPVRHELVEDITARAVARCVPLIPGDGVPEHFRALTSTTVLGVEHDLVDRILHRAEHPARRARSVGVGPATRALAPDQRRVVAHLVATAPLVVVEGAAGAGKTTTLAAARETLDMQGRRMVVVTPTLKAAQVAQLEVGTTAFSVAWLIHQHGYRWDEDGHRHREHVPPDYIAAGARLGPGDLLLVDEAGMLDQDTATALFTIADEQRARVALLGDRHQLPAVGRGGVLDHAIRWTTTDDKIDLDQIHRFTDHTYADLTLHMRTGHDAGWVFDQLLARGEIRLHATDIERATALARHGLAGDTVIADTREQVALLNAHIRDQRHHHSPPQETVATRRGEILGVGDLVTTRLNDRAADVANRERWTITAVDTDGGVDLVGDRGRRRLAASYVADHVELAYVTTVHGAQGDTVEVAHFVFGEGTGAAAAYVAMTRGRRANTAHLVADTTDDARVQWVAAFNRDRADLGPAHARERALDDIDLYGVAQPQHPAPRHTRRPTPLPPGHPTEPTRQPGRRVRPEERVPTSVPPRPRGPGMGL